MANDLFEGLQQFFTLFAELQDNEFYITGESYAGKYIPALGFKIDQESATAKMKLKGLAIGAKHLLNELRSLIICIQGMV